MPPNARVVNTNSCLIRALIPRRPRDSLALALSPLAGRSGLRRPLLRPDLVHEQLQKLIPVVLVDALVERATHRAQEPTALDLRQHRPVLEAPWLRLRHSIAP